MASSGKLLDAEMKCDEHNTLDVNPRVFARSVELVNRALQLINASEAEDQLDIERRVLLLIRAAASLYTALVLELDESLNEVVEPKNARALYLLGLMHQEGMGGLETDSNAARRFFEKAASQKSFARFPSGSLSRNYGQAEAATFLGVWDMERARGFKEQVEAFLRLCKGTDSAYGDALYNVGRAYWLGQGTLLKIGSGTARSFFEKAIQRGSSKAQVSDYLIEVKPYYSFHVFGLKFHKFQAN